MRCQLIGLHFLEVFLHFCKVGSHFKQIAAGYVFRRNYYRDFSTFVLLRFYADLVPEFVAYAPA